MQNYPQQKLDAQWVHEGITPEIIEWTKSFGEYLCKKDTTEPLTTAQLRKFFGEIKRIEMDKNRSIADIIMLKPLLAYAVGRDKKWVGQNLVNKTKINEFAETMTKAIDAIRCEDAYFKNDFSNFVNIFESIVAYHKYYGAK